MRSSQERLPRLLFHQGQKEIFLAPELRVNGAARASRHGGDIAQPGARFNSNSSRSAWKGLPWSQAIAQPRLSRILRLKSCRTSNFKCSGRAEAAKAAICSTAERTSTSCGVGASFGTVRSPQLKLSAGSIDLDAARVLINPRIRSAISSALVSSPKCPASSTTTFAFGTSAR